MDDDLEVAESLESYFSEGEYRTAWAMDLEDVKKWYHDLSMRMRDSAEPRLSILAIVRADTTRFKWEEGCDYVGKGTTGCDIVLTLGSSTKSPVELEKEVRQRQDAFHVLSIWRRDLGHSALGSILTDSSAMAGRFDADERGTAYLSKTAAPSAARPVRGVIRYRAAEEDMRLALEMLVEAAEPQARPCAAILFRIHQRTHSVKIVVGSGDEHIIAGFRLYEHHFTRAPFATWESTVCARRRTMPTTTRESTSIS